MPNESNKPVVVEEEPQEAQPDIQEVLTQLTALRETLSAEPTPEPEAPPVVEPEPSPPPPPPPEAPPGRVTRQQYDELARWGAQMRQEVERLKLAREFSIDPSELEGDFESPMAMRQHAEILSLRKAVEALSTQSQEEPGEPEPPRETPPAIPQVDTGGPTGSQKTQEEALQEKYAHGRCLYCRKRDADGSIGCWEVLHG